MTLSSSLKPDLYWRVANIMSTTNLIKQEIYELEMYLDASLSGWGGGGGGVLQGRESSRLVEPAGAGKAPY